MKAHLYLIGVVITCVCFGHKVLCKDAAAELELQDAPISWPPESIGRFSTNFLQEFASQDQHNAVVSPFGIWALLLIIYQAAEKETAQEIKSALMLPDNRLAVAEGFFRLNSSLVKNRPRLGQVNLVIRNFLVRNKTSTGDRSKEFFSLLKDQYGVEIFSLAFQNAFDSAKAINDRISNLTHNRITEVINPGDLNNLQYIVGNVLYFKGQWRHPFKSKDTFPDQFKDENDEIKGNVQMMAQANVFPYAFISEIDSQVIEIPYADGRTSMVVILPRRRVSINDVLTRIKNQTLDEILKDKLFNEETDLYLPSFNMSNELVLNSVIDKMKMIRMFSPRNAELPMFSNSSFISKIKQKVEIENNEAGTTAAAVTIAQVSYKTGSATFHANRPFIYLINDIKTRTILFAGLYRKP